MIALRFRREARKQAPKKGMSAASGIVLLVGLVGLILFGYFTYQATLQGGANALQIIADGAGLIISAILMGLGFFGKLK
jgi:hypothetical protein